MDGTSSTLTHLSLNKMAAISQTMFLNAFWYEPMMLRLPTHICVIRPQWVIKYIFSATTKHLAWCPFGLSCVNRKTSNGSWCMGNKGEMSGTVCVAFTWDMYIYELFIAFVSFFFVHYCNLMVCVVYWVGKWQSRGSTGMFGNLFIISCYSLYKTTLGLLCSWFENNPHFHKYSMDFHV